MATSLPPPGGGGGDLVKQTKQVYKAIFPGLDSITIYTTEIDVFMDVYLIDEKINSKSCVLVFKQGMGSQRGGFW